LWSYISVKYFSVCLELLRDDRRIYGRKSIDSSLKDMAAKRETWRFSTGRLKPSWAGKKAKTEGK
jgi:hypothetical protein